MRLGIQHRGPPSKEQKASMRLYLYRPKRQPISILEEPLPRLPLPQIVTFQRRQLTRLFERWQPEYTACADTIKKTLDVVEVLHQYFQSPNCSCCTRPIRSSIMIGGFAFCYPNVADISILICSFCCTEDWPQAKRIAKQLLRQLLPPEPPAPPISERHILRVLPPD
jgi:hypothetical protein